MKKQIFVCLLLFLGLVFLGLGLESCDSRKSFIVPSDNIELEVKGDSIGIPSNYSFFLRVVNGKENERFIVNMKVLSGDVSGAFFISGQVISKDTEIGRTATVSFKGKIGTYTIVVLVRRKDNPDIEFSANLSFKIIEPNIFFSLEQAIDDDSCKVGVGQVITLKSIFNSSVSVTATLADEFELRDERGDNLPSPFTIAANGTMRIILLPKLTSNFIEYFIPFTHKSIKKSVSFTFNNGIKNIDKEFSFVIFDNLPPLSANMVGRAEADNSGIYQYFVTLESRATDRDSKWNTPEMNENISSRFLEYDNVSSSCTSGVPATTYRISTLNTFNTLAPLEQGCQGTNPADVFRLAAVSQDLSLGVEKNISAGSNPGVCTCCSIGSPPAQAVGNFNGTSVSFVRIRARIEHTDSQGAKSYQIVNIEFNR